MRQDDFAMNSRHAIFMTIRRRSPATIAEVSDRHDMAARRMPPLAIMRNAADSAARGAFAFTGKGWLMPRSCFRLDSLARAAGRRHAGALFGVTDARATAQHMAGISPAPMPAILTYFAVAAGFVSGRSRSARDGHGQHEAAGDEPMMRPARPPAASCARADMSARHTFVRRRAGRLFSRR